MQSRRRFLAGAGSFVTTGLATPAIALPDVALNLIRQRTGESFRGQLMQRRLFGRRRNEAALNALNHFLRDLRTGIMTDMDLHLIDLIARIQRRLDRHPIMITSAYRTPGTNAALRGSATNSFHMRGQALDLHVKGVSTGRLRRLARQEGAGGIGWYPARGFVHVDTGPRREWRR